MNKFKFQQMYSLEKRTEEANRIMTKYYDRIPVIVEKIENNNNIPDLDKSKYLVPKDITVGQFMYIIRKRIHLKPEQALFIFLENGSLPLASLPLSQIYQEHKNLDNFLYLKFGPENFFGDCFLYPIIL